MKQLGSRAEGKSCFPLKALVWMIAVLIAAALCGWVIKRALAAPPTRQRQPYVLSLGDSMTVNLADSGHEAYLRCSVQLGLLEPMQKPDILVSVSRDALITIMARQTSGNLLSTEGRERARAELLKAVGAAGYPQVSELYFTEFLVQR